ncbi:T-cell leukemia homeobox protein 3-like isoform X1 [Orbicella faveolata]|uniref:T-cell leukemia homeobox protein 3-like isoform X1 n=1 Tax=Orbicella faveolata TaxID=48498 RepID=UPI0009E55743|nr:T-cell leukemia homeobox protein 3-like isoform X1 [Orbicella faveolata]
MECTYALCVTLLICFTLCGYYKDVKALAQKRLRYNAITCGRKHLKAPLQKLNRPVDRTTIKYGRESKQLGLRFPTCVTLKKRWADHVTSRSCHAGVNVFPKKRRRPMQKKKQRPLFSPHQIQTMEKEFATQRYVTEEKRAQLALTVNLTEAQVKTWFQNRRTKWKKERKEIQQNMNQTMRGNTVFQSNCAAFGFV